MHHYAVVALLFATPNIDQTPSASTTTIETSTYQQGDWLDKLIIMLEALCQIIGEEFCQIDEGGDADSVMSHVISTYLSYGVPGDLSHAQQADARKTIANLHDHVCNAEEGSASICYAMAQTLESMYQDLGGDLNDLE